MNEENKIHQDEVEIEMNSELNSLIYSDYSSSSSEDLDKNGELKNNVNIMILGASGEGKSSLTNAITSKNISSVSDGFDPGTNEIKTCNGRFGPFHVCVKDTVGFNDSHGRDSETRIKILNEMKQFTESHGFVFVLSSQRCRYDYGINILFEMLNMMFRDFQWFKHLCVVFTHFDYDKKEKEQQNIQNQCKKNFQEFFTSKFGYIATQNQIKEIPCYFVDLEKVNNGSKSYDQLMNMMEFFYSKEVIRGDVLNYSTTNYFLDTITERYQISKYVENDQIVTTYRNRSRNEIKFPNNEVHYGEWFFSGDVDKIRSPLPSPVKKITRSFRTRKEYGDVFKLIHEKTALFSDTKNIETKFYQKKSIIKESCTLTILENGDVLEGEYRPHSIEIINVPYRP